MTSLFLIGYFWKKIVTKKESCTNFKINITKFDQNLLQSVTGITKCDRRL